MRTILVLILFILTSVLIYVKTPIGEVLAQAGSSYWSLQRNGSNQLQFFFVNNGANQPTALTLNSNGTLTTGALTGTTGNFSGQGNRFGGAAGSASAPTTANTNILLYNNSASNWSGIGSWTDGSMYFVTGVSAPATRLFINNVGSVGVGTTSPLGKFAVSHGNGDQFTVTQPVDDTLAIQTITNGYGVGTYGENSYKLNLQPYGYVGIGTNTPGYKLDVNGQSRLNGPVGVNTYPLSCGAGYTLCVGGNGHVSSNFHVGGQLTVTGAFNCLNDHCPPNGFLRHYGSVYLNTDLGGTFVINNDNGAIGGGHNQFAVRNGAGGNVFAVTANGTIWCAVDCRTYSDSRYKKDIQLIPHALDKILALRGVNFFYDKSQYPQKTYNFPDTSQVGFIAQEVEQIIPELVDTDQEGFKGVSYGKVSALLVEGIKEQQKEIKDLKAEVEELKKIINELKNN